MNCRGIDMSWNNITPALLLTNPYKLPIDNKWYYWYERRDKRFGPFSTKQEALIAEGKGEEYGYN